MRHYSNKVEADGYVFDSEKEYNFYIRFVKYGGYPFDVHPSYVIFDKYTIEDKANIASMKYTPDFVIYEKDGTTIKHVYDVKNSFGIYGIDQSVKMRFKLFAMKYNHPVEAVVVRKNDFKVITQSLTKSLNEKKPYVTNNFDYHWKDATNIQ